MLTTRTFIATALIIILASGCASLPVGQSPEVKGVSPRITGLDFDGLDMAFDVDVNNPYPIPIKTPQFRYGIDVEGSKFFDSKATSQLNLPAGRVGTVTLPVRLSYTDLLKTYKSLGDKAEADYLLRGDIILPLLGHSLSLPISHGGTFPVLRAPTFSNINVDLGGVSLFKTRVNVDTIMKNPNAFPLDIKGLGYMLKMGGSEFGGLSATTAESLEAGQSGSLSLSGEFSAASAIVNMIKGGSMSGAEIVPSGSIQTPYGVAKFR